MEHIPASLINKLMQQIGCSGFNLLPVFSKLYILTICKHFCFKQGCNVTYLFCFIVYLMSPKFLNMDEVIVAYKVVVFRINKTDFLMQLIPVYFFLNSFLLNSFLQRVGAVFASKVYPFKNLLTDLTSFEFFSVVATKFYSRS